MSRHSFRVIVPAWNMTSGSSVPKKKRAASRAFVSKYGNSELILFFRALYALASVISSIWKKQWNRGRALLPSLGRLLWRLKWKPTVTSGSTCMMISGVAQNSGLSL